MSIFIHTCMVMRNPPRLLLSSAVAHEGEGDVDQVTSDGPVERWGMVEVTVPAGPGVRDRDVRATFRQGAREVPVAGFVAEGRAFVRFMPDAEGAWTYEADAGGEHVRGAFDCVPAAAGNHGPVAVLDAGRFAYADGTGYRPVGTTCYVWNHQDAATQAATLDALASSPFNKLRMCVFPKNYAFNEAEPARAAFVRAGDGFDLERFDAAFFAELEAQIRALGERGIECDLILFHPYDRGRWGFDRMDAAADERYLRHVIARLGAFRNVWWSLANEYDFMTEKDAGDWEHILAVVHDADPYGHLTSIHNGTRMYEPSSLALFDHADPRLTHVSLQHWDLQQMRQWRDAWGKPVVVDECGYEGDLPQRWGDLTAETLVDMFWTGFVLGGYVGHGETFEGTGYPVWWSHGGALVGESPDRIAFLRAVLADLPDDAAPLPRFRDVPTFGVEGQAYLQYFGQHRPGHRPLELPEDADYDLELIDTWSMERTPLPGPRRGTTRVDLPARPRLAVLARRSS